MSGKFQRANLSAIAAVRIGLHGLWKRPLRLIAVLLLTAVSLVLLGLSVTAALYEEDRAIAESMARYDRAVLAYREEGPMERADVAALETATGKAFGTMYEAPFELLPDFWLFTSGSAADADYLRTLPMTCCVLTEEVLSEAEGYSLTGRLPEKAGELALPCCLADAFLALGYYDHIASPQVFDEETGAWLFDPAFKTPVSAYEELLGKRLYLGSETEPFEAIIVGVLEYDCSRTAFHAGDEPRLTLEDQLIVSEEYALANFGEGAAYAVSGPPKNVNEAAKLYEYSKTGAVTLYTSAIEDVLASRETIEGVTGAFGGVGAAFALFAGALIFQFISLSIEGKRGEVGILRSLGARESDVCRIFFSESCFLALVSALIAIPATVALSYAVNALLFSLLTLRVAVLNFTVWMPVSILLLSLFVSFAATVFPVLKEAKKPPVEAIRMAL